MRRLAVQKRKDDYLSKRDYQTLHPKRGIRIIPKGSSEANLTMAAVTNSDANSHFIGFGGYVAASKACELTIALIIGDDYILEGNFKLANTWTRIGMITEYRNEDDITVQFKWPNSVELDMWGINADRLNLPDGITSKGAKLEDMRQTHLIPETLYLTHEKPLYLEVKPASGKFDIQEGRKIELKKCSYCGRLLPVNMKRLGTLAFHKHNAKRCNHQNECRSCKKWRINDTFNPLRTFDQLNESSIISRERKLFLREPQILQEIKERTGAGLKSQVWNRFGKKCFYCGKELNLDEVELDHTRPMAYLWPIDEHATCLCAEHNNQKKEKFPIDFYSEAQIRQLSEICGLPYEQLCMKDVNEVELDRILKQLSYFAEQWDPRTFAATARKIKEVRADIDLFELLRQENEPLFDEIMRSLKDRPPPVLEE